MLAWPWAKSASRTPGPSACGSIATMPMFCGSTGLGVRVRTRSVSGPVASTASTDFR
ncbi:hypothetical protein D3C87_1807330 [compost metagenome]